MNLETGGVNALDRQQLSTGDIPVYNPIRLINNAENAAEVYEFIDQSADKAHVHEVFDQYPESTVKDIIVISAKQQYEQRRERGLNELCQFVIKKHPSAVNKDPINVGKFLAEYPDGMKIARRFEEAQNPQAAIELFLDEPLLASIELASHIHPLNWGSSIDMHRDVLSTYKGYLPDAVCPYEFDNPHEISLAKTGAIVIRQGDMKGADLTESEIEGFIRLIEDEELFLKPFYTTRLRAYSPSTDISLVERFSYLIDMDGLLGDERNDPVVERLKAVSCEYLTDNEMLTKRTKERLKEIGKIVYEILDDRPEPFEYPWVQPIGTSFYVARDSRHAALMRGHFIRDPNFLGAGSLREPK